MSFLTFDRGTRKVAIAVAAAATAAIGSVLFISRTPDGFSPQRDPRAAPRVYRTLVSSDFEALARDAGLPFTEAHAVTPPPDDRRDVFAVYATFGSVPIRQRIAYQFGGPPRRNRDGVECLQEDLGWECFRRVDDVVVQGEAYCVASACEVSRKDAMLLLELGVRHLAQVGGSG